VSWKDTTLGELLEGVLVVAISVACVVAFALMVIGAMYVLEKPLLCK
jgi:hypothetical protein